MYACIFIRIKHDAHVTYKHQIQYISCKFTCQLKGFSLNHNVIVTGYSMVTYSTSSKPLSISLPQFVDATRNTRTYFKYFTLKRILSTIYFFALGTLKHRKPGHVKF